MAKKNNYRGPVNRGGEIWFGFGSVKQTCKLTIVTRLLFVSSNKMSNKHQCRARLESLKVDSLILRCLWMDNVKVAALLGSVAGAAAGASGTAGWTQSPPDHNPAGTELPCQEEEEEEDRKKVEEKVEIKGEE